MMPAMPDEAALGAWVVEKLGGRVARVDAVQTLWSGYGRILRFALTGADAASAVVKHVTPPDVVRHPRGWGGDAGHQRKLRSYEVERAFYAGHAVDRAHRTARCHAAESDGSGLRLLLEDLDFAGYGGRRSQLDDDELGRCLGWLASFHAAHLGRSTEGLWQNGTYWHLATRQDELRAMKNRALREAAAPLDAALRSCPYRTWVHGDAKVANFCFAADDVAAVDFQYVGGGCGVQDVAYFLSSCLDDAACERQAASLLDVYFAALRARLPGGVDGAAVERAWRALYPAAWADFHRFLNGWAPDHWKLHGYTRRMTRQALDRL
jgi:hypothetical protein